MLAIQTAWCLRSSLRFSASLRMKRPSIKLPARWAAGSFALALIRLFRLFGVIPALFAATDAAMGPQSPKNHFGGGCGGTGVLTVRDAGHANMLHSALDSGLLL